MAKPESSTSRGTADGLLSRRPTELLGACENTLIRHLLSYVTPAFEDADKNLFDQAAKAASTEAQNRLFEAMSVIKGKISLFTEALSQEVHQNFQDFIDGKAPPEDHGLTFAHNEMSLVEDQDLEESLAITQIVSKAEIRNTQAIYALNQRLAVINRGTPVKNDTNPCGPLKIGTAIRAAARCIEVSAGPKVILFNAMDRQIHERIGKCYEELNQALIDAGILPNLKLDLLKKPAARTPAKGADGPDKDADSGPAGENENRASRPMPGSNIPPPDLDFFGRATAGAPTIASAPQAPDTGMVRNIRQMLSDAAGPAAAVPPAGVSVAPQPALQSALSNLQVQQSQPASPQDQVLLTAAQIKQALSKSLTSSGKPMTLAQQDSQTIDIMGMLYDHIKDEELLHQPVEKLLHRLQVPMLRVALQEEEFFEDTDHPARRLFNTIADAGQLWLEDKPEESPTFNKMQVAVDKILTDYQDDLNVFKDLLDDLDKHIGTLSKKARLAEKRQVEKARGQEKLELAREQARTEMERLIKKYSPPRFVESVLEHPWTDFLALTALRYGDEGDQWREARTVAKTLIFSVRKNLSDSVKAKLRTKVPWLKQKLRDGLSQVGYFEQDVKIVLGNLETCHRWSLAPKTRPAADRDKPAATESSGQATADAGAGLGPEPDSDAESAPSEPVTKRRIEAQPEPATKRRIQPRSAADDTPSKAPAAAPAYERAAAEPTSLDEIVIDEPLSEPPEVLNQPVPRSAVKPPPPKIERKPPPKLNTEQKSNLARIRLMPFGTWFELLQSDGLWVKRKLSWYSPVTGRCLFVNNRGLMAQEMNLHDLAIGMSKNTARVFEAASKPLMDRAFESIFRKLKGMVSKPTVAVN